MKNRFLKNKNQYNILLFPFYFLCPPDCSPIKLNHCVIPHTFQVKYKGLIFDKCLARTAYLKDIEILNYRLSFFTHTSPFHSIGFHQKLFLTYLRPIWTYRIIIWRSTKPSNSHTIQNFQSICRKIIFLQKILFKNTIALKPLVIHLASKNFSNNLFSHVWTVPTVIEVLAYYCLPYISSK